MAMHVMLDLETLGKVPGSVIRSVGAIAFDPVRGVLAETFYANVDQGSCEAAGLTTDPDTVDFWARQSEAAQLALTSNPLPLGEVLGAFADYWKMTGARRVWAHGATFDQPLMEAAYRAMGRSTPWRYSDPRDTRTIYELAGVQPNRSAGVHHDAAWDARNQAEAVIEAYRRLRLTRRSLAQRVADALDAFRSIPVEG